MKVAFMGSLLREEWMYKIPRVGNDMSFLNQVANLLPPRKSIVLVGVSS